MIKRKITTKPVVDRMVMCPACNQWISWHLGGEDGFFIRKGTCTHVLAYGENETTGKPEVTFETIYE